MNPFKPSQGIYTRVIPYFGEDQVFCANEQAVQDIFSAYDKACSYHIESAVMAVSDKAIEKQAAYDLGFKEGLLAALRLIPNTQPSEGDELTTIGLKAVLEDMMFSRNNFSE